ncbi:MULTISPECIES: hypothetical protein [Haloferax]|uniref:DUF8215 domain-containing protein n=1 Tax=Haloferax marinum TaxID=2666143 RepID=A0A6A8G4G0_9EURY|nr:MULTISPECIES: hypothetical protein [Haloferax]KAB1196485.1 hypothetical protein Hfx1150_02700 [Haloferax sp. CBA1150]MRW95482.1 hypothetical protein [Haloferax marinum]
MSPNDQALQQLDERPDTPETREKGLDGWLDAIIYYGLGQHMLLALPTLWIAFQTVSIPVAVTTSAIVSLTVASVTIGAFRMGVLSTGHPWHRIEDNELGLGPDGGYGFLVRRAAYLNTTLGLATFAGAIADASGWGLVGAVLVGGGFSFGALYVLPNLRAANSKQSVPVRVIYYAVSLSVVASTGQVLELSVGAPSAALAFAVVCLFTVFDVGADLRKPMDGM